MRRVGRNFSPAVRRLLLEMRRRIRSIRRATTLPARALSAMRKYRRRISRQLMPDPDPPPDRVEWDSEALTRILDATTVEMLSKALEDSQTGRIAVNGLTVTLLETISTLVAGLAALQASTILMARELDEIERWLEGIPPALDALLRLEVTPILTQVQSIVDGAPKVIDNLVVLVGVTATSMDDVLQKLNQASVDESFPPQVTALLGDAIEDATRTVERLIERRQ